jgi:ADP-heptose:LPS heptosyltransferase
MKITYFCKGTIAHLFKELEHANITIATNLENVGLYEYHCYVMSLPYFLTLRKAFELIPNTENYIKVKVDVEKQMYWKQQLDNLHTMENNTKKNNIHIGFFCKGLLNSYIDKHIPMQDFAQLTDLPIHLICLHRQCEITDLPKNIISFNLDPDSNANPNTSFVDTIALIQELDLVLTVDTSIVHLAGIMNIPTLLLLGNTTDWRWFSDNEKVWYNSVELMRVQDNQAFMPMVKQKIIDLFGL